MMIGTGHELRRSLEFMGCPLGFRIDGCGPPVIFIQGVGVHGDGWLPQIEALSADFTCLSIDNRGMGRSVPVGAAVTVEQMASDVAAIAGTLGWESYHVVAHSLGGPVAIELALTQPSAVRSLSLLCTVARGMDATAPRWRLVSLGIRTRVGTRAMRRRAFLQLIMPAAALKGGNQEAMALRMAELFGHDLADQPDIAMTQLAALRAFDATNRIAGLTGIPTLVMSGRHDPIAPPQFGRALAAGIAGATFVEFADASHGLPIHRAAEVNARLRDHINRSERKEDEVRNG